MTMIWIVGLISITVVTILRLLRTKGKLRLVCGAGAYVITICTVLYILINTGSLIYISVYLIGTELPVLIRDAVRCDI